MPRKEKTPHYYYHVSDYYIGNIAEQPNILLTPLPHEASNRPDDEPHIARTCVAPSIAHCLTAMSCRSLEIKWYIYRTKNKVKAFFPYDVADAKITKEKWLLTPTRFFLYGILDVQDVKKNKLKMPPPTSGCGSVEFIPAQKKYFKQVNKILNNVKIIKAITSKNKPRIFV